MRTQVLVVAHRLNTIIDSDKVLVFDFGTLVECDHPHKLLEKPPRGEDNPDGGYFSSMVAENSATMQEKLRTAAKEAYDTLNQAQ
jgi:ATP-binding cassette subfamily C (CFTR/MRP) protein 4